MKKLKFKTVIIPLLICAVVGGIGYITITNTIKKENDFANGVAQHNYLRSKLGGVDGKAVALR